MAIRETLELDLSRALNQLDDLERQLDSLLQPIEIPIDSDQVTLTAQEFRKVQAAIEAGVEPAQAIARATGRVEFEADQAEDAIRGLSQALDISEDEAAKMVVEFQEGRVEAGRIEAAIREVSQALDLSEQDARELAQQMGRASAETREMSGAGRAAGGGVGFLQGNLRSLITTLGVYVGAREFFNFARDSIAAASDLEESLSKTEVVFGDFAEEIITFSTTAPSALGLSNAAALETTATFGNLFVALGLTESAAADLAPEIVQLGADLASFNNIEVDEALVALRSGLVGEVEPLRRLGVAINAAVVEAKALELGLVGASGELTEAAKVQARYALILEQTSTAQGDFARTADGIANRQRTLSANFQNLRADIGEALIPAFEQLLDIAPAVIEAIRDGLVPAIAAFSASIESVDVAGITRALAGLPSAIGTTITEVSSGAQAVGNALQVFGALAQLDFEEVGAQFNQLDEDIQALRSAPIANAAIQNLITTLLSGVEPAAALESVLVELGDSVSGLTVENFEVLASQLLAMATAAGASEIDLFRLGGVVEALGRDAGFSEEGVRVLAETLRGPFLDAAAGVPPPLDEIATAAANADAALGNTQTTASGFDLGDVAGEIGGVGATAQTAAERLSNFAAEMRELVDPAFAAIRAESDLATAQEQVNETLADPDATADDRRQALIRLAEAQAEVNTTAAGLPSNLGPAAEAITQLLTEAGVEADNIQILVDQLDELDGTTAIANIEIRTTGEFPIDPNARLPGGLPAVANDPVGSGSGVTIGEVNIQSTGDSATDLARLQQAIGAVIE